MSKALRPLRMIVLAVATLGAFLVATLTAAAFFGSHSHKLELLSNLRMPLLLASSLILAVMLAVRARRLALIPAASMAVNLAVVAPLFLPVDSPRAGAEKVTIATINIFGTRNKNYDRVIQYVHEKQPDVLCLNEMTRDWMQHLTVALPEYHYRFDEGVAGGAAIFSRLPIEKKAATDGHKVRRYGVRATMTFDGKPVLLVAEHPPAPVKRRREQQRNGEFARLASEIKQTREPVVIIGDMNATAWSPYFQELVQSGNLRDSELGYGLQPTWSQWMVLPLVPIDHCLTSKDLVVTRREVGPDIGSDHLPLCVDVRSAL